MTEYNLELERVLKQRPLPGKQAEVSVERIIGRNKKRRPWLRQLAVGFTACILTVMVVQVAWDSWSKLSNGGNAPKYGAALGEVLRQEEPDEELENIDWSTVFKGALAVPGMEVLHHESLDESSELAFIVKDGGEQYPFQLITAEINRNRDGNFVVRQTFESAPLESGKSFNEQIGNDWISYQWGTVTRKDGEPVRFAYGYIMNDRVAEVRLSNETGQQESALILTDSKGQRYWFNTLSDRLGTGLFVIEALHREGEQFFRTDSEGRLTESWKYKAIDLTYNEWLEISSGETVNPNVELLINEEKPDGSLSLFAVYYDKNLPITGYSMASVDRAGTFTTYASLEGEEGAPFYEGNLYFYHTWRLIHTNKEPSDEAQIIGLIRNSNVAAIRLTNHRGEQQTLELIRNHVGDAFFYHSFANDWVDFNKDIYIEALDGDGETLYMQEEVMWFN